MILIFSNSKIWGGVEVLVTRFAEYLRANGISFCLVEPAGTRLYQDLQWANPISPSEIAAISEGITHVFVPSVAKLRDPAFPWGECRNAEIFAWVVHPNDPLRSFFPFSGKFLDLFGYRGVRWLQRSMPSHAHIVQSMFAEMLEKKALSVMDGATTRALNFFYPSISTSPILIPIPSSSQSEDQVKTTQTTGLSVGYLGRLDDFKFSALGSFVSTHLAPRARLQPVALHVVAEGPRMSSLRLLCNKANVSLHEYGFRPNDRARSILRTYTHFAVAMGTASLDIAGAGHPCVIIDPALKRGAKPQTLFRFVHEIEEFTLGEYRDFPGYKPGVHEFEEIIDLIDTRVGLSGRDYVRNEHNAQLSFGLLIAAINSSSLTVGDLALLIGKLEQSFRLIRSWPRVRNQWIKQSRKGN